MVHEILYLLSLIQDQEDMDVIAYHVRKKQEVLRKRANLLRQLNV